MKIFIILFFLFVLSSCEEPNHYSYSYTFPDSDISAFKIDGGWFFPEGTCVTDLFNCLNNSISIDGGNIPFLSGTASYTLQEGIWLEKRLGSIHVDVLEWEDGISARIVIELVFDDTQSGDFDLIFQSRFEYISYRETETGALAKNDQIPFDLKLLF